MRPSALLLALPLLLAAPAAFAQTPRAGNPEDHLPPGITQLTAFGERAAWSPDGKRIAFIEKSFKDAFEIDLQTRLTRLITGHFPHAGFLRVQYLPNGDYFLIGARDFRDARTTRDRDEEMWVMKAGARAAPVPLGRRISEGVAISRTRPRIAWSNTHGQYPDEIAEGESVLYVADIDYVNGVPHLGPAREVLRARRPRCTLEAQDFRNDDNELIYTCYRAPDKGDIYGIDLNTGKITTYRQVESEYDEAEGISPDGKWILVESSRDQGADRQDSRHIDLWRLRLEPGSRDFVRLTRWGDFDGYKASNPVVSPDGRFVAFQSARSVDPAGVGYGLFLLSLAPDTSRAGAAGGVQAIPAASIRAAVAGAARAPSGLATSALGDRGAYSLLAVRRERSGEVEEHAALDDIFVVQEGAATVRYGGTLSGDRETAPNERRGGELRGFDTRHLTAGDLMVIPAGIPHQVVLEPGASFTYLVVKVARPH